MSAPSPTEPFRAHAEVHAREGESGVGAAVTRSEYRDGVHRWDVIVTDGAEWHYLWVLGPDLGPFPDISTEDIERAIDRFASTLPAQKRIFHLVNANPLHVGRDGVIAD